MQPAGIVTFGPATGHTATPTFLQTVAFLFKSKLQVIVPTKIWRLNASEGDYEFNKINDILIFY